MRFTKPATTTLTDRERVVHYVERTARWRADKAAQYPDERRNGQCADGLWILADHIRQLPDTDARIAELVRYASNDTPSKDWYRPRATVARALSRFRWNDPTQDPDKYLTFLARLAPEDQDER